jgi:DNA-binding LytR/AlgR family response regulator
MTKCIIVDDEALAQQVIQSHLRSFSDFEVVAVCCNATEAAHALKAFDVDLIFLDIQLPGVTGLNFLKTLTYPPLVILTTAFSEYAVESYEFSVIDYLLKPISLERFSRSINKVVEGKLYSRLPAEKENPGPGHSPGHMFIKSGSKFFKVNYSDIIYIESMKDYLKIHTGDYNLVTHQTMTEMEKLLPAKQFIRVHKSFIVSVSRIRSVDGSSIETEKHTIPIGLSYKNNLMSYIAGK